MLDDIRKTIRKIRGDYHKNPETSIGRGRKVVRGNLPLIIYGIVVALIFGGLKARDAGLLVLYGGAPFIFDSTIFLEALPVVSRIAPRISLVIELGLEAGAIGVGISLGAVYTAYRLIGAISMGIPYYQYLKEDD